jgi:glycerol-3-phosphate dehydrogenase
MDQAALPAETIDLFVIGGGINGVGIARDAAGRGLSVVLCEKDDLAEGTSSRSGKLIHGGLRYLEYYEFALVRKALIEREVLLAAAPHIIWPMRFVLPHSTQDRPAWLLRLGLFLYDHLGGRKQLPATRMLNLRTAPEGECLRDEFVKGFEYSDCWVDDARLVVLNALDAHERGAHIMTRTRFESASRRSDHWLVTVRSGQGSAHQFRARALANAAGPWVNTVVDSVSGTNTNRRVQLVKGSHLVVPKFWNGPQAYLVQNVDKRVIFVNPYEKDFALIGTTDIPQSGQPESATVDEAEVQYLIDCVNRYFRVTLTSHDVVSSFTGVRPLFDDASDNPSAVTRDYVFDIDGKPGSPPLLSVFGGKITTFRKLAEHAVDKLAAWFPHMQGSWTQHSPLPGGDIQYANFNYFLAAMKTKYTWLSPVTVEHLARLYGTRIHTIIGRKRSEAALGKKFSDTFYEAEVRYLLEHEWAQTIPDVLDRRTKHGLHLSAEQRQHFDTWWQTAIEEP